MSAGIDKAVILAAGLGNRISAVSETTAKPLLPIDGHGGTTTFLDWHLESLHAIGVREIYIVGNKVTHGTKLRAMQSVKAEWISNPTDDLSTSGSAHSAWFAWSSAHGILDGKSRVVLMDADIVYEPALLDELARAGGERSKTLVCASFRETQEEVVVYGDPPRFHGKGLTPALVGGAASIGEATGIVLFEPGDHALVREVTDWLMRFSTAKTRSEHEDITQRMMGLDRMSAVCFGGERLFMEVDTPDEYEVLVTQMWPKLARLAPR